jgi:hypothetical protein
VVIRNWSSIPGLFSRLWQAVVQATIRTGQQMLAVFAPIPALIINLFTGAGIGQRIIGSIIDGLKARAGALFSWVGGAVNRINSMVGGGGATPGPAAPSPVGPAPQPRANGGRVLAGMDYLVGERRPEIFRPDRPGRIIPRVPRPAAASSRAITFNAGGITINAPSNNATDIRAAVLDALDEFQRSMASNYRLALND